MQNYDHGSDRGRDVYICEGLVGLLCALRGVPDQENAIEYVSSLNTKEKLGFRLIADGLRSTMTEDIVYESSMAA